MRGDEAAEIAEGVDNLVSRIYAYMALGIAHLRKGDFTAAISNLKRAYQLSEKGNLPMAKATVAGYLGRAYTLSGRATEAISILKDAVDVAAGMELMVDQGMRFVHLSEAHLRAGQLERATSIAHVALQSARDTNQRGTIAWTHWLLGEICTDGERFDMAEGHYRNATALASELGMTPLQAHCHFGSGGAHGLAGKSNQAREQLIEAVNLYKRLEMSFWTQKAEESLRDLQSLVRP